MDSIVEILAHFISPNQSISAYQNIIPYLILLINFILFKLLRSFSDALFDNRIGGCWWWTNHINVSINHSHRQNNDTSRATTFRRLLRLLIGELISTCELCADCAELNVVYEKHGSYAYAAGLFLLSYLWIDSFGDAQTTPGYLLEELCLVKGQKLLTYGETYARFIGQSLALPLAWRFASIYWKYHLLPEHKEILEFENCKSALTTSTIKGFFIEFGCCLLCRLIELIGHKILDERGNRFSNKRLVSVVVSFSCTLLVMLALELSGGYFNPILAASLEYGCKGIQFYQHAIVFWLGPLMGHVLARFIYRKFIALEQTAPEHESQLQSADNKQQQQTKGTKDKTSNKSDGRPRRTTSQRRKRHRD